MRHERLGYTCPIKSSPTYFIYGDLKVGPSVLTRLIMLLPLTQLYSVAFKGGMEDSLGSLALPPGGFDPVDQSIALTRFPPQPQPREQTSSPHTLSTITEDVSLMYVANAYCKLSPIRNASGPLIISSICKTSQ